MFLNGSFNLWYSLPWLVVLTIGFKREIREVNEGAVS